MTDIPLRDQIAETVARKVWGAQDLRSLLAYQEKRAYDAASALLEAFDIQLRSPHPAEEES